MGMVLGIVREEMPRHEVLSRKVHYEVRSYAASLVAECKYAGEWGSKGSDNSPFGILARYIGVFGVPQNERSSGGPEPIAMTAPVLVSADAVHDGHVMSFVLPASRFKTLADAPVPTDPRVTLRELPARIQAVRNFSWEFTAARAKGERDLLLADLEDANEWVVRRTPTGDVEWTAAGYNPPFTLPWLKRNEVMVSVDPKTPS